MLAVKDASQSEASRGYVWTETEEGSQGMANEPRKRKSGNESGTPPTQEPLTPPSPEAEGKGVMSGTDPLPELEVESVYEISETVARSLRLIPIKTHLGRVQVVCARPLTEREKEIVRRMSSSDRFDFVSDPERYPEVRNRIDELLDKYFPEEDPNILDSPEPSATRATLLR